jgi:hypothetical protein
MKFKVLTLVLVVALLAILAVSVSAQDMPTPQVNVGDQLILGGFVTIDSVYSEGPGFVVIHRASDGGVVGNASVAAGWTNNLRVSIDTTMSEAQMSGMLHVDDGAVGTYEFGTVEGADAPVKVGDAIVNTVFNAQVLSAGDQVADGSVTIKAVAVPVDSWVVVHSTADESFTFGGVLGQTLVPAGTATDVVVELSGDVTSAVWPMLHVDDGAAGTYEFGTVEGADAPVVMNGQVASFPIWTEPHLRVKDQIVVMGDGMTAPEGMTPSVKVESVLADGPSIVVIHANDNGNAGAILGATFVPDGLSQNITVELDPEAGLTPVVWPMLHTDGGDVGVYVDNEVDPPVSVADGVVTFTINAAPALVMADQAAVDGTITIENALMDAPGWLALHSDNEGAPGPVIATAQLHSGANWHVTLTLPEGTAAGTTFFPMLHYDTGEAGVYEFGTVEGADAPVFVGGNVIVAPLVVTE